MSPCNYCGKQTEGLKSFCCKEHENICREICNKREKEGKCKSCGEILPKEWTEKGYTGPCQSCSEEIERQIKLCNESFDKVMADQGR